MKKKLITVALLTAAALQGCATRQPTAPAQEVRRPEVKPASKPVSELCYDIGKFVERASYYRDARKPKQEAIDQVSKDTPYTPIQLRIINYAYATPGMTMGQLRNHYTVSLPDQYSPLGGAA